MTHGVQQKGTLAQTSLPLRMHLGDSKVDAFPAWCNTESEIW